MAEQLKNSLRVSDHFKNEEEFEDLLNAADDNTGGEWEQTFLADMIEKYDQYGTTMFLSPKQLETLERIRDAR